MRGLVRTYRRGTTLVEALRGIDLDLAKGEIVFFLGPSGSGKSTLLHLLAALDTPTAGTVAVEGQDLFRLTDRQRSSFRREKVGMIFQSFHLIPTLDAVENVLVPRIPAGVTAAHRKAAQEMLQRVGLAARLDHRPDELSGGECQRVAICRALLHAPTLLLADEPTGELDTEIGAGVMTLLRDLVAERGTTLVVVTHDETIIRPGERVVRLRDGRVVSDTRHP